MKSITRLLTTIAAGAVLSLTAVTASAGSTSTMIDIDVAGIASWDGPGDANNVVLTIDIGTILGAPGSSQTINGLGWDVVLAPVGASWFSEMTATFTDSGGGQGISLSPGAGDDCGPGGTCDDLADGVNTYSSGGILVLAGIPLPDIVLADGILLIEFSEGFDDVTDAIDGNWLAGTLTVQVAAVPVPPAFLLLFSGLLSTGFFWRKKT